MDLNKIAPKKYKITTPDPKLFFRGKVVGAFLYFFSFFKGDDFDMARI